MIRISTPSGEYYDDARQEFVTVVGQTVLLEHSLRSLAKWEARWKKPFLSKQEKSRAETIDYVRCMAVTPGVDPSIFETLTSENLAQISQYINNPMTATTFSDRNQNKRPSREIVTAELIYYWMVALQIPFECQDWHLNRLLTLIHVCEIKNQPKKKVNQKQAASERTRLNRARKAQLGTTG